MEGTSLKFRIRNNFPQGWPDGFLKVQGDLLYRWGRWKDLK